MEAVGPVRVLEENPVVPDPVPVGPMASVEFFGVG